MKQIAVNIPVSGGFVQLLSHGYVCHVYCLRPAAGLFFSLPVKQERPENDLFKETTVAFAHEVRVGALLLISDLPLASGGIKTKDSSSSIFKWYTGDCTWN
ncbi:MAG: hypothetical protein FVQ81_15205 [Candidatus Glassbacteria bacterium]|nr:hypothetical protein [Candidatus Glassbacteria bacterium]